MSNQSRSIPLTTWWRVESDEITQFVGRDVIILKEGKHFWFIKNASLERLLRCYDEKTVIIDLSDSKYLTVDLHLPPLPDGVE
ncbi:MAG TPA: hypothetical protein VFV52_02965 [Bacilli bacterium]|nr:hypothetical protein [Bacilli bacterium]